MSATKWGDIYIAYETIASRDEQLFTFNIPFEHEPNDIVSEKYDIQHDILHNMHSRQNLHIITNAFESMKQPFVLSTSTYYDIKKKLNVEQQSITKGIILWKKTIDQNHSI